MKEIEIMNTVGGESDVVHDDLLQDAEVRQPIAFHAKHCEEGLLAHVEWDLDFWSINKRKKKGELVMPYAATTASSSESTESLAIRVI